ncbi:HAD-IA family hydrolase [Falsigemmobacter faecalis]|uniref:phosphoglycolate phosphatase n=1 Tax=Falsigemmobacter faecalis TaxID=2488730 RepID=A0A3P3DKR3_9RHOB|nr:HAD-IA family hydrolase [Falsigemmobacter faecalis]RRH74763.1 HAD family hydrolase [Falsigemmobacter faecalis]
MPSLVFDLDGTLIDSAPDIAAALNQVLKDEGLAPLSLAQVIGFIGNGIPALIAKARTHYGLSDARQEVMLAAMLGCYRHDQTRLYPGVREALSSLKAGGYRLGLCTNKNLGPTHEVLAACGLAEFFEVVIGGDSLAVKKPDSAPLQAAFAALGGTPFLYIGDSEVDEETARRAALPFAFFTGGYCHLPEERLTFALKFDSFAGLPEAVRGLAFTAPETSV